jgi:sulfite dehydrogenase (quinone) subunit SoeC
MHPALSVIFFTTAAGVGYGMLTLLGLLALFRLVPPTAGFGVAALAAACALVAGGLLSSTFHLGRPERAWRALSQWRTSWLSREGVAAILTFVPVGLFGTAWLALGPVHPATAILGIAMAAMAAVTIYCTAMIYASLRTVHQWHNAWVVPNYALLALFTGAAWLHALLRLWGEPGSLMASIALAAGTGALACKLGYWRFIDTTKAASTPETATGLGALGRVRLFEAPHTEDNYLMREMGFRIARKHAAKLRRHALVFGFGAPLLLTVLSLLLMGAPAALAACVAALSAGLGVFLERWLFFAEAKHTVTLYYGAAAA